MKRVDLLIEQVLQTPKSKDCNCGCGGCKKSPLLKESKVAHLLSEGLTHHIKNKIPLHKCEYEKGSDAHLALIREARKLYSRGIIEVSDSDKQLLESDLGYFGEYKGEIVPLDLPILNEEKQLTYDNFVQMVRDDMNAGSAPDEYVSDEQIRKDAKHLYNRYLQGASVDDLFEAEYQGRKVKLNKPMAGDVKKFKVYVKNPKGNVVKVNFGDPNMRIKKSDPARRKSFRARHNCDNPGPKTKARYWSCRAW